MEGGHEGWTHGTHPFFRTLDLLDSTRPPWFLCTYRFHTESSSRLKGYSTPSHPSNWLRLDYVLPALYLVCKPVDAPHGSGIAVQPALIDAHVRRAWMPYFRRDGHPVVTPRFFEMLGRITFTRLPF